MKTQANQAQIDSCLCEATVRGRQRRADQIRRGRLEALAALPRQERNAKLATAPLADLLELLNSHGPSAVKVVGHAPDRETQDYWVSIVHDRLTIEALRSHLYRSPPRIQVTAKRGLASFVSSRKIHLSREQGERLVMLGLPPHQVRQTRGTVEDKTLQGGFRECEVTELTTQPIDDHFFMIDTRELLDALAAVDRSLANAIEFGDVIVTPVSDAEGRMLQAGEDKRRAMIGKAPRLLERLPIVEEVAA